MRSTVAFLAACCATLFSAAADSSLPLPVMTKPAGENGWLGFSLLPKAFQRNPQLEMTVISELTEYGRSLPPASPDRPVYYVGHNTGFTQRGDIVSDYPPDTNYLGRLLRHALQTNGYLPATQKHPPTLMLIFHWGAHNAMDREMRLMFPELARRHTLERSILVGGRRFESSVARRMSYGDFLTDHTTDDEFLIYQANAGIYFAVISAYDVRPPDGAKRRLVWRASLTANTSGVSMTDTLPALLLSAAPIFGRDMPRPEVVLRRVRRGVVEYGPATVVETDVPLPAKSN